LDEVGQIAFGSGGWCAGELLIFSTSDVIDFKEERAEALDLPFVPIRCMGLIASAPWVL
jgi:hypothetical protein